MLARTLIDKINARNPGPLAYCDQKTLPGWAFSILLPNQELLGAKSELQGETVCICSFYKRSGQPPYNSALRSLQMFLFVQI